VNAIHILAYDYHDTTYHVAAHHAPLYAADTPKSADAAVQAYLTAGVKPELLVLGIPLYGRAWSVNDPSETTLKHGLYQPIVRPTQEQETLLDYAQIQQMIQDKALAVYTDPIAHATYAFSTNTGLFVTYDSIESVKEKVEYTKTKHLGGLLFWSLESDMRQGADSLVSAAQ
jgi:chitinase